MRWTPLVQEWLLNLPGNQSIAALGDLAAAFFRFGQLMRRRLIRRSGFGKVGDAQSARPLCDSAVQRRLESLADVEAKLSNRSAGRNGLEYPGQATGKAGEATRPVSGRVMLDARTCAERA